VSVFRLATGPVGTRFSAPVQTGPGVHPASCTIGIEAFPGVKSGRGVTLTPHPLLVLWSWKSRAIPLLPLWAVRPVQSLSRAVPLPPPFCSVRPLQSLCSAIPLLPLWTVRPVQSLNRAIPLPPYGPTACTEPQCLNNDDLYLFTSARSAACGFTLNRTAYRQTYKETYCRCLDSRHEVAAIRHMRVKC
jgi:hypothetical protein